MKYFQFLDEIYVPASFAKNRKNASMFDYIRSVSKFFRKNKVAIEEVDRKLNAHGGGIFVETCIILKKKEDSDTAIKVAQNFLKDHDDNKLCIKVKGSNEIIWKNY